MSNGNDMIVVLIVGLIKRPHIKMRQYFPKLFRSFGGNINVKMFKSVDLQIMQQNWS